MKRILIGLLLLVAYSQAYAATTVLRNGVNIDQYKISDPGNVSGYDNHIVYITRGAAEVVIQVSGVNKRTFKESMYCWEDVDVVECPTDDIGGGVLRSPVLVFLESILNDVGSIRGATITPATERLIYLAFWHEYGIKKLITDSLAEMELEGFNPTQKRARLKYVYFGNGIDLATSQALAVDRVTNGTIANYTDYNLVNVPVQDRRLIKLFGNSGWYL